MKYGINEPLPRRAAEALARLEAGEVLIIGNSIHPQGRRQQVSPSSAQSLVRRGLAVVVKPEGRGPKKLVKADSTL